MDPWGSLEFSWLRVSVVALPFVFAAALYWSTRRASFAHKFLHYAEIEPATLGAVGLLFGLFSAFLAADIWQRASFAYVSVEREAGAIQNLINISGALEEDGEGLRRAVQTYVTLSRAEEWAHPRSPKSEKVEAALRHLVVSILRAPALRGGERFASSALLHSYQNIIQARVERFHVAGSHTDIHKWAAVMLLGLLAQLAIAAVHLDKPRAHGIALGIFTSAFTVTLLVLAVHEGPVWLVHEEVLDPIDRLRF